MDTVERAVSFAMTELKVETLKDKQKEAICSLVNGRDCFVATLNCKVGSRPVHRLERMRAGGSISIIHYRK